MIAINYVDSIQIVVPWKVSLFVVLDNHLNITHMCYNQHSARDIKSTSLRSGVCSLNLYMLILYQFYRFPCHLVPGNKLSRLALVSFDNILIHYD